MVSKIREAVGARSDPDFLIIGRTNARRRHDMDETLRRAEAYHKAGADMLFVHTRNPDEMRVIGERLPPPLMIFAPEDGFAEFPLSPADLAGLGFRLAHPPGPRSQRCTRPCALPTNRLRAERSIRFSAGAEPPAK